MVWNVVSIKPGYKPLLHCPQPTTTSVAPHNRDLFGRNIVGFLSPDQILLPLPAPLFCGSIPNTCHITFIWCAHVAQREATYHSHVRIFFLSQTAHSRRLMKWNVHKKKFKLPQCTQGFSRLKVFSLRNRRCSDGGYILQLHNNYFTISTVWCNVSSRLFDAVCCADMRVAISCRRNSLLGCFAML